MNYENTLTQAKQEALAALTIEDILALDKKYFSSREPKGIMFVELEKYFKDAGEKYGELPIRALEELTRTVSAIHEVIWQKYPELKDRKEKEKSVLKTKKQEIDTILTKVVDKGNEIIKSATDSDPQKLSDMMPGHMFNVFFADYLRFEVGNGGYGQFIRNSKALYNELIEIALGNLGASEYLARHKQAIAFTNNNPLKIKTFLQTGLPEIRDEIDYLMETKFPQNTKYYDLKPSLFDYIYDYINKYRQELLNELISLSKKT